jgi:hypothetical protein
MIEETKQIMCYPSCTIMSACGFHIGTAPSFFGSHVPAARFFFFFFFFFFFGFFFLFFFCEWEISLPPIINGEMRWAVPQMRDVFICSLSFCDYLRFHVLTHSFIHLLVHAHAAVIPSTSVHLYHIA